MVLFFVFNLKIKNVIMISLKEQLGSQQEQINSKRIGNFVKLLKAESKQLIETGPNGKGDFRKHQMTLESLLDVSPTSTTDLSLLLMYSRILLKTTSLL